MLFRSRLTKIENISTLTNLQTLVLSSNLLTKIENIDTLTKLTSIGLNNNKITEIPKDWVQLNLLALTKGIPDWRSMIGDIIYFNDCIAPSSLPGNQISLDNNPLISPPPEIYKQGIQAMRTWWQAQEESTKRKVNELKIIIVGEGTAGKTSLLKRLCGLGFSERESKTNGVYIQKTTFSLPIEGQADKREDINVRFWDFGGQETMHASHQFFLSKRAVYLLVLDNRRGETPKYWLETIRRLGGDAPIIIVQNKIDEDRNARLSLATLQKKYPNVKAIHEVSCKTETGIQDLVTGLSEVIQKAEMLQTLWAASWLAVKEALEDAKDAYISLRDFGKICAEKGVKTEAQTVLLNYLHDLGVILHFSDIDLQDINVLHPSWITEAVYKIINSKRLLQNNGILNYSDLEYIFKQESFDDEKTTFALKADYSATERRHIVELMKRFELCFRYNESAVLVPDLLPVEMPVFTFDKKNGLQLVYDYGDALPPIMPHIMTKLHEKIEGKLYWRKGFVVSQGNTQALIEVHENQVFIWVNGSEKRDFLAHIRAHFSDIHQPYSHKPQQHIPCNCLVCKGTEKPHFYQYDALKMEIADGEEKIKCPKSREKINISDLLGEIYYQNQDSDKVFRLLQEMQASLAANQSPEKAALALRNELKASNDSPETFWQKLRDAFSLELELKVFGMGAKVDLVQIQKAFETLKK